MTVRFRVRKAALWGEEQQRAPALEERAKRLEGRKRQERMPRSRKRRKQASLKLRASQS